MTEPNLNPPDDNFEQRAATEVYFETLEAELEKMESELDAANNEIAQRDTVIDEMRVELDALRTPKQPDCMSYGQLFAALVALLPADRYFTIELASRRQPILTSFQHEWTIYVAAEIVNAQGTIYRGPTAEAALGAVMVAQLRNETSVLVDEVAGDTGIEDAPTIPPPTYPVHCDDPDDIRF